MWFHWVGNALTPVLPAISLVLRLTESAPTVSGVPLILSMLVVLIFAATGWLGGEMAFRHGVGLAANRPPDSLS